ncbi:helix-turn-helix transcriptional regulator [Oscillatoria salina IIICB1]|nr:helix-turn-helix transcriptional regulator [Oscillatoria salina IIICB1]
MILNDLEYQTTKERIAGFQRALTELNTPDNKLKKTNPVLWQLNVDGVQSLLADFSEQIQEYEALISRKQHEPLVFEIDSLAQLPQILIKARLAAKISQSELANRLGIEASLLQRYEDREYESATLTQLLEISQILGISILQKVTLEVTTPAVS